MATKSAQTGSGTYGTFTSGVTRMKNSPPNLDLETVTIKIERQGDSFVANSLEIPELQTEGATLGETLHNLTAAYALVEEWSQDRDRLLAGAD